MNILIIKFRSIGDVLLSTPLIRNLKLHYKDAKIYVAINSEARDVLTSNPDIDGLLLYDRKKIKSGGVFNRIKKELLYAKKIRDKRFDMVINTTEGDRGAILALLSGAKIRVGITPKNWFLRGVYTHTFQKQGGLHIVEWGLKALEALGLEVREKKVYIYTSNEAKDSVDSLNLPQKYVHIHPVSRWSFKALDAMRLAKIIDYIELELNTKCTLTASSDKKELTLIENMLKLCKSSPILLCGRLSLQEVAEVAKRAYFFIGADSAVMHIAAAVDTPVLAFFGPSGAFHWGAWDNSLLECGYKDKNGIQTMGKHTIYQVDWECAPCGKDGCGGSKVSKCLIEGLNVERVKSILKEKIL